MASVQVLLSIGTIVVSFVIGIIFYYLTSSLTNKDKKSHIEEIAALMINFIIYIWIGKIIVNFSIFIKDPLAVLAYPSNSKAFYLAILFITIHILYKSIKHQQQILSIIDSFVPIFLVASFTFEFIQITFYKDTSPFSYLVLLMILIVLYFFLAERLFGEISYLLMFTWAIGQLGLTVYLPYVTVFGYMISRWFLLIFLLLVVFMFFNRKKVT